MKWQDKITLLKEQQYTKHQVLDYIKKVFAKRGVPFTVTRLHEFEKIWHLPIAVNYTIEDIIPEVDLPSNLSKTTPLQRKQVINIFKHLDHSERTRRWKILGIALNLAHKRNKKKDIENFTVISDLVYEAKLIPKEQSSMLQPLFQLKAAGMTGTHKGATKEQLLRFKQLLTKYHVTALN